MARCLEHAARHDTKRSNTIIIPSTELVVDKGQISSKHGTSEQIEERPAADVIKGAGADRRVPRVSDTQGVGAQWSRSTAAGAAPWTRTTTGPRAAAQIGKKGGGWLAGQPDKAAAAQGWTAERRWRTRGSGGAVRQGEAAAGCPALPVATLARSAAAMNRPDGHRRRRRVTSRPGKRSAKGRKREREGSAHREAKWRKEAVGGEQGDGGRLGMTVGRRSGDGLGKRSGRRGAVGRGGAVGSGGMAGQDDARRREAEVARVGGGSSATARLQGGRMDVGVQRGVTKLVVAAAQCGDSGKRRLEARRRAADARARAGSTGEGARSSGRRGKRKRRARGCFI
uniref:Retrotransposon protein, putative, Ty3-gypsy subclass n=1 Tax=Oryza sativa subsp. japonica TaxID=39947 RepID=Q2QY09_ORYSJ|nr:retrotransposon protein, putative, Ty3-gypsy subclass [Oryza sativa Japonica Group]